MDALLQALAAPFPPDMVEWRCGSTNKEKTKGMALAYIDARCVMERFDSVVGPAGWQRRYPWSDTKRLCCEIGIKIDGEWIWKGDGAGDTDVEAEKGAFSDAFKRAAVSWGVGRYLYGLKSPWVEIEAFGRSYKIKDSEKGKLDALLVKDAAKPAQSNAAPQQDKSKSSPDEFWKRDTYVISTDGTANPAEWVASRVVPWAKRAPTTEALAKLEEDNKGFLKRVPAPAYQEFRTAVQERYAAISQKKAAQ